MTVLVRVLEEKLWWRQLGVAPSSYFIVISGMSELMNLSQLKSFVINFR
ncbi:hypothetical protein MJ1HA_1118 [Metallosphaera sedula]|nr:hypothetical protein MJ1HA_1118 [Metallosphaera sedula]